MVYHRVLITVIRVVDAAEWSITVHHNVSLRTRIDCVRECEHFYRFCRVWTANLELLKQSLSPARHCRGGHYYHPHHCRGGHHYHPHDTAVVAIVIARKPLQWWPSLLPARHCRGRHHYHPHDTAILAIVVVLSWLYF